MDMCNFANRGLPNGDSFIRDTVNPVPRRKGLKFIRFNGIKYYRTPYRKYYVSKAGVLLSTKQNKYYFPKLYERGNYYRVALYINKKRRHLSLHRLVMETFYGKCPSGYSVDHIDRDTHNNALSNLRYLTLRDNIRRASCETVTYSVPIYATVDNRKHKYPYLQAFVKSTGFSIGAWKRLKKNVFPKGIKCRYFVDEFYRDKDGYHISIRLNPNRQLKFSNTVYIS